MPPPAGGAVIAVQPALVKKRKTGFRVGTAAGPSVLSGLVVHGGTDDAGDADEDSPAAGGGGFGDALAGGGSVLAGLQLHAAAAAASDAHAGSAAAPSGVLAGLQMHSSPPPEPPKAVTPPPVAHTLGGGGGAGLMSGLQVHDATPPSSEASAASAAAAAAAAAALSAPKPDAEGGELSGGVFAGLRTKTDAASPVKVSGRTSGAAAPPARAPSPTERKRAVVADLDGAARQLRMRLAEIKQRLRTTVEADRKAGVELSALRDSLAQREAEQDDAIRHERFEAAEALNAALEEIRTRLARSEATRKSLAAQRAGIEAEQEAAFAESLAASSDAVMGLKRYTDDRETVLSAFGRDAHTRLMAASDRIENDEEQLRLKEEHVRLETKLVEEETQQVHRAIEDQTNELNAQVADMRARHEQLVLDVAELERQLELRRREGACARARGAGVEGAGREFRGLSVLPSAPPRAERMASSQLADAEARIKSIHAKFDKQTKRLQAKRAAVNTEQSECSAEAEAIANETYDRNRMRAADAIKEHAYRRQIEHTRAELGVAEALRAALLDQADRRRKWTLTASSVAKRAALLSDNLESGVKALRQVQSKRAGLEAQVRCASQGPRARV